MTWGDEAQVRQRFGAAGISPNEINFERGTYRFRQPGPPSKLLTTFRTFYGPMMNAFEAAERNGRADELAEELGSLFNSQNCGGADTDIPATFLKVTVTKR
jgi:hypothetical protein